MTAANGKLDDLIVKSFLQHFTVLFEVKPDTSLRLALVHH